ncbi:hypothetical protein GGS21DRAFT_176502 [Xylaria nigripes]|nr:hypothetical protein GGS21DRAFT_176502 [Xylaria nigripes]
MFRPSKLQPSFSVITLSVSIHHSTSPPCLVSPVRYLRDLGQLALSLFDIPAGYHLTLFCVHPSALLFVWVPLFVARILTSMEYRSSRFTTVCPIIIVSSSSSFIVALASFTHDILSISNMFLFGLLLWVPER